jgi:hypothetical protein
LLNLGQLKPYKATRAKQNIGTMKPRPKIQRTKMVEAFHQVYYARLPLDPATSAKPEINRIGTGARESNQ